MGHGLLSAAEIARLKWRGISDKQLLEFEARQRKRISELEVILQWEREELEAIIDAMSSSPLQHEVEFGSIHAPAGYSRRMTWKDKIILVMTEAKRPMLAREIGPVLIAWEPLILQYMEVDNAVSVHLSQLVKAGAVIREKRKGRGAYLYSVAQ
jgi:DNA-binding transcriptional ArsR family regulator